MTTFERLNKALINNLQKAGIYEHSSHYILSGFLNSNSYIIDLGANVGNFYTLMHNKYNCTCYAVEASPKLYADLPAIANVKPYHYAIGGHNGEVEFYLSNESEANSVQPAIASAFGITGKITVPMITLEKFLNDQKVQFPLDLLKIDIEGAEVDVINTLPDQMLNKIKQIPIEFHDFLGVDGEYFIAMHKAIAKLKANNFKIIRLSENDYRAILCINRMLVPLTVNQKIRLSIIHPIIINLKLTHSALSRFFKGDKTN
ncbi:MAG TPA: FkbM family methyltransferase [Mucilaginibacter sp.]|jgi:FkbM family methyltransferase